MTKQTPRRPSRPSHEVLGAARPIADQLARVHGLLLWDLSYFRQAGRDVLRVALDKVGGVGADDLALYADELSRDLDHAEAVPGEAPYVLEVTSPGAERRLEIPEHFQICRGRLARVSFNDGRPPLDGVIGEATADAVAIETEDGIVPVAFSDVARAQLRVVGIG
jgi:ribosome maturation factor RimP